MTKLAVYDPPMCCSTGVCGPVVDPVLPRFAADLDWLKSQGVDVARFNLAHEPQAFAANLAVVQAFQGYGDRCLPLVLVDGRVVLHGRYPSRAELAQLAGLGAAAESDAPTARVSSCCSPGVVSIGGSGRGPGTCC